MLDLNVRHENATMIHYFKFRQDLFGPQSAKDIYIKRGPGKGWPEECPPIRAANGFGFDLLANFDITFVKTRTGWSVEDDVVIESDFEYATAEGRPGQPLKQQYAWFWEKGQRIPHVISDNVYPVIANQVKVSSYLFLRTDPNELLFMTEVPNQERPWRTLSALVDTDWYPASYPWHMMLELEPSEKRIAIKKGESLCRIIPVRRDTYFAQEMPPESFDRFFERGQRWLSTHGKPTPDGQADRTLDITGTYVRQQIRSKFVVM